MDYIKSFKTSTKKTEPAVILPCGFKDFCDVLQESKPLRDFICTELDIALKKVLEVAHGGGNVERAQQEAIAESLDRCESYGVTNSTPMTPQQRHTFKSLFPDIVNDVFRIRRDNLKDINLPISGGTPNDSFLTVSEKDDVIFLRYTKPTHKSQAIMHLGLVKPLKLQEISQPAPQAQPLPMQQQFPQIQNPTILRLLQQVQDAALQEKAQMQNQQRPEQLQKQPQFLQPANVRPQFQQPGQIQGQFPKAHIKQPPPQTIAHPQVLSTPIQYVPVSRHQVHNPPVLQHQLQHSQVPQTQYHEFRNPELLNQRQRQYQDEQLRNRQQMQGQHLAYAQPNSQFQQQFPPSGY